MPSARPLTTGQPVGKEIKSRLPASAELTLFGLIVSMMIAVPLGIAAATNPGSWIDHACRVVATAGVSLPVFFTGLILVYVFYYILGWAPAPLGRLDVFTSPPTSITGFYLIDSLLTWNMEAFASSLKQLLLPALTLAIFSLAPIARMTRAEFLALRDREFVQACRAMGMNDLRIIVGEILPNALPPVIVLSSLVVAGAVLFESAVSFLGLGDPNLASWGRLVGDGRLLIRSSWYICAIPGVAIRFSPSSEIATSSRMIAPTLSSVCELEPKVMRAPYSRHQSISR